MAKSIAGQGQHDLQIIKGSTFLFNFTYKSGPDANTQTPVDLTGYTARMQIRKKTNSTDKIVDLTTENGGIVLGGVDGTVAVTIAASVTAAIVERSGVYDLELVQGTYVRNILGGAVEFIEEVTK
jgi:hypothetical protein